VNWAQVYITFLIQSALELNLEILTLVPATPCIRSALFWDVTHYIIVITYQCFRMTCWSCPWGGTNRLSQKISKELSLDPVISQKSTDHICVAAEAWNHVQIYIDTAYGTIVWHNFIFCQLYATQPPIPWVTGALLQAAEPFRHAEYSHVYSARAKNE